VLISGEGHAVDGMEEGECEAPINLKETMCGVALTVGWGRR
jgi:hypothetical protein